MQAEPGLQHLEGQISSKPYWYVLRIFYNFLTQAEKAEWDEQVRQSSLLERKKSRSVRAIAGSCNFAIQRQLFESLAGFDKRFPYAAMEDVDLRLRLTKIGHKFSFVKAVSVCHPWSPTGGWKKLKQHQESTLIYLSLHPEESYYINSKYYLMAMLRTLIKSTIPGLFKFKGDGVEQAFLEHFSCMQMFLILLKKSRSYCSSISVLQILW